MNTAELLHIRLHNQLLSENKWNHPHEIVSYMGAMQAQVFDMARWAIGVRLPGITDQRIIEAIDDAKIIRTHILRPTWHFVATEDIHWMRELSKPRLYPIYLSYARMSGANTIPFAELWPHLELLMRDGNHLTRQELQEELVDRGVEVNAHMVSHLLSFAELEGLVCNGRIKGKNKQTFCLLQERVPKRKIFTKEESLEKLARKFFTSHAPATLQDFIWWSGLLASDAKKALKCIKDDFVSEEVNGRVFWMKNDLCIPDKNEMSVLLLPPFDEMVVSYKDRSEMIDDQHYGKVMTKNGLFSPTVMMNGKIIGSWRKKKNKKNALEVELSFFEKTSLQTRELYKEVEKTYLNYLINS